MKSSLYFRVSTSPKIDIITSADQTKKQSEINNQNLVLTGYGETFKLRKTTKLVLELLADHAEENKKKDILRKR